MKDWKEKIRNARGYNMVSGDSYIVFENTNEIWDSEDLIDFIDQIISERQSEIADRIKYTFNGYGGKLGFTEHELLKLITNTN